MVTSGSLNTCNEPGKKYYIPASANISDRPSTSNTLLVFVIGGYKFRIQLACNAMGGLFFLRTNNTTDNTVWNNWYSFSLDKLT